ncbi:hypothetical protein RCIP0023_00405 [Klebsiella phage RCIP0023]
MKKRISKEQFLQEAHLKFNSKFIYLINDNSWTGITSIIGVICPDHGIKYTTAFNHRKGLYGCMGCLHDAQRKNIEQFINESIDKHGNLYDYSKVKYINKETKVCIICPIHGEFWQTPADHIRPYGCKDCARENSKIGYDEFVRRSNIKHNNKYDYSKVEYNRCDERVCIICPKHGEFWQFVTGHMHSGNGCINCAREEMYQSKPVLKIKQYLLENNYNIVMEKSFSDCRNENTLPFDFYLEEYNLCIEYDGEQHYKSIEFFGGEEKLIKQQQNDSIKNQYCKDNNINLLRIRFDEDPILKIKEYFNNIRSI